MRTRILSTLAALCCLGFFAQAQQVLADFEDQMMPGQFEARQGEITVDSVRQLY